MTKKEAKRDSKLLSHITFQYKLRCEMRGVIYATSLFAFSTLLMLVGYFYEFYTKDTPSLDKLRLRIVIYLCYWLLGLLVCGLLALIVHYIANIFRRRKEDYDDRYLAFADYELGRMLDKGKLTESEVNRFFLNDAMIALGIDPFSKPYVLSRKEERALLYNDDFKDEVNRHQYKDKYWDSDDYISDEYYEDDYCEDVELPREKLRKRSGVRGNKPQLNRR